MIISNQAAFRARLIKLFFYTLAKILEAHCKTVHGWNAQKMVEFSKVEHDPFKVKGSFELAVDQMASRNYGLFWKPYRQDVNHEGVKVPDQPEKNGHLEVFPGRTTIQGILVKNVDEKNQGGRKENVPHDVDHEAFRGAMDLDCQRVGWGKKEKEKKDASDVCKVPFKFHVSPLLRCPF